MTTQTITPIDFDDAQLWESGTLGADERFAKRAPNEAAKLDEITAMQSISIRLPVGLIEGYRQAATLLGKGYQPLMRDAIERALKGYIGQAIAELEATGRESAERSSRFDISSPAQQKAA